MWTLFFFLFFCGYSNALTDAEAKLKFVKFVMACTKHHSVTLVEIMNLQNHVLPTDTASKCLLACAYREIGTLDAKGMYNVTKGYEIAEQMREGDDKRVENGKKMADTCEEVNKETVSDGAKGCERAGLMFKCMIENAPKFGFEI